MHAQSSGALPNGSTHPNGHVLSSTHVYFDFFGTLLDYDPSVHPAGRNAPHEYARRLGLAVTEQRADVLWQRAWDELNGEAERTGRECSLTQIATRYAELLGVTDPELAGLEQLTGDYLDAWTADVSLAAGVRECLADLARDHTLAVVSNAHDPGLVRGQLERFGIAHYFSDVCTSVDIGWRKPHPEIFRYVLALHGIRAADAVFVGDTWEADVTGPRAIGMPAVYVGPSVAGRAPVAFADLANTIRAGSPPHEHPEPAQPGAAR